ncbi:DUF6385 domain-containing protein [Cohnella sp. AR92]|uniref:DUF6385 domain-containing protein n=1 Tax=Cohnella sp. AR92 TaxID=648716 RepID=UPI000F8DBA81|nr:DUF6385 domain-containing protein [Cohnella sp. AR92]RUS49103.1 hypothetical protein ELR57_01825 [Cohnella sp. AR92]
MPNFSVFNTNPDYLRTLIFGHDSSGVSHAAAVNSSGQLLTVIMDGTLSNINISGVTVTSGTLTNILNGTITSVLGATITAGTLTNLLNGTITSVLGATITAGTLTNLLNGTITSVLGATITAGTLTNLLNGTITSVLGATITAGTLSSVTSISQKSFQESASTNLNTADAFTALPAVTTSVLGTYSFFVYNKGPGTNKADARVEVSANGTNWFDDVDTITGIAAGSVDVLVPKTFLKYTRLAYRSSAAGSSATIDVYFNAQGT